MIKDEILSIRIQSKNRSHYESIVGHELEIGSDILINSNKIPKSSHFIITGICDFCFSERKIKMKEYNNGDVITLEAAYLLVLPYITNHPNLALMNGDLEACPNCGSHNLQKRGLAHTRTSTFQRLQCKDCHSWHQQPKEGKQVR